MRRINVRRILFALGLGAIVTVLVAWGLDRAQPTHVRSTTTPPLIWPIDVPTDWPMSPDAAEHQHRVGADFRFANANMQQAFETKFADPAVTFYGLSVFQFGWPCRALAKWDGFSRTMNTVATLELGFMRTGVPWPKRWPTARSWDDDRLPIFPLWPGFAINTLVYGAFAWAMMAGVSYLKHRRRAKPGMCVACGYPVSGFDLCPECGTAAASSVKPPAPEAEPVGPTPV